MKKHLFFISGSFIFGLLIISALYLISDEPRDDPHPFERRFPTRLIEKTITVKLAEGSYYLAGLTTDRIYLGNRTSPSQLIFTGETPANLFTENIQAPEGHDLVATQFTIDPPYLYVSDLSTHTLFRGVLKDLHIQPLNGERVFLVSGGVPIGPSSFALRTWKDSVRESVLAKRTNDPPYLIKKPELLEKQIDGVFCTDGILHYNKTLGQLIYLYYYRNQFICMDTSLNLLYRGNTLDTVSYAGVKVGESDGQKTLKASSKVTKGVSSTSGRWLFIHSKLRARNEGQDDFRKASVIDVHDLTDSGAYAFSFYLPRYKGQKPNTFKVFEDRLVAIYGRYLVTYNLNNERFLKKNTEVQFSKVGQP